ncbi:hypothetical protein Ciccas_001734 [Cichlidogyrus casuarinus]|uniref:G-protein coupled receptors family 1 profile domain-containing protein n=1 Tax=Cichlidogyrus casuarinus TaxID=1844966 RepID=A0ABD2QJS0_9PLAT
MDVTKFFQNATIVVNMLGVIGNAIMICVLNKWSMGGKLPNILFLAQALSDLLVCLQSVILMLQPKLWLTHNWTSDQILCRLWHSQFLYWLTVQMSIGNLVLIGFERYCALVYPLHYQKWRSKKVAVTMFISNLCYNLVLSSPNIMEGHLVLNDTQQHDCITNKYETVVLEQLMLAYAFIWFIFIYLVGLFLLVFFYFRIIMALKHSAKMTVRRSCVDLDKVATSNGLRTSFSKQSTLSVGGSGMAKPIPRGSTSSVNAHSQFTRIAILITIFYVLCITYDAISYILGKNKIIQYDYGSIEHTLGMFTVSLNSFANPVIYFGFVVRQSCVRRVSKSNMANLYICCRGSKPIVVVNSSAGEKTDFFKTKNGKMPRIRRNRSRLAEAAEDFGQIECYSSNSDDRTLSGENRSSRELKTANV